MLLKQFVWKESFKNDEVHERNAYRNKEEQFVGKSEEVSAEKGGYHKL